MNSIHKKHVIFLYTETEPSMWLSSAKYLMQYVQARKIFVSVISVFIIIVILIIIIKSISKSKLVTKCRL